MNKLLKIEYLKGKLLNSDYRSGQYVSHKTMLIHHHPSNQTEAIVWQNA
jgi:hypothetical protein